LIGLHKSWWNLPDNQKSESYDPEFTNFVNGLYKQEEQRVYVLLSETLSLPSNNGLLPQFYLLDR
jgi:hypothetical protein